MPAEVSNGEAEVLSQNGAEPAVALESAPEPVQVESKTEPED